MNVNLFYLIVVGAFTNFHGASNIETLIWISAKDTLNNVYLSVNMGDDWLPVGINQSGNFYRLWDIEFADIMNGWAVGELGLIYHSRDGGYTWELQDYGSTKYFTRIKSLGPELAVAGGGDNTFAKTTTGGADWDIGAIPAPVTTDLYGIAFLPDSTLFMVGGTAFLNPGGQGLIAYSTDWGENWEIVDTSELFDFFDVFFIDSVRGFVAGGVDTFPYQPLLLHSEDAGESWSEVSLPKGTRTLRAIFFPSPEEGWAVGEMGTIIHTKDGGVTWEPETSITQATLFDLEFSSPERGVIVGDSGIVLVTLDGGKTWELRSPVNVQEKVSRRERKILVSAITTRELVLRGLPPRSNPFMVLSASGRVTRMGEVRGPKASLMLNGLRSGIWFLLLDLENERMTFPFLLMRE